MVEAASNRRWERALVHRLIRTFCPACQPSLDHFEELRIDESGGAALSNHPLSSLTSDVSRIPKHVSNGRGLPSPTPTRRDALPIRRFRDLPQRHPSVIHAKEGRDRAGLAGLAD